MADPRHVFGRTGEELAEAYLKQQGFKLLARRYTTPVGELDLVALEGNTVVFVEVKSRRDRRFAEPEAAVTPHKMAKLARAANWFLRERRLERRPARFDVLTIVGLPGQPDAVIEHHRDFFVPPAG